MTSTTLDERHKVMGSWMSGFRGSVLMIVLWVIGWGLGYGGIIEAFVDPDGRIQDIWPTVLAIPGFIGGLVFSALLVIFERGRRFDEISLPRIAVWGIVAGVAIGLLSIVAKVGDVSPGGLGMTGIAMVLGVVSGLGSGIFFRLISRRK